VSYPKSLEKLQNELLHYDKMLACSEMAACKASTWFNW